MRLSWAITQDAVGVGVLVAGAESQDDSAANASVRTGARPSARSATGAVRWLSVRA